MAPDGSTQQALQWLLLKIITLGIKKAGFKDDSEGKVQ
jgi:hypothetical protein